MEELTKILKSKSFLKNVDEKLKFYKTLEMIGGNQSVHNGLKEFDIGQKSVHEKRDSAQDDGKLWLIKVTIKILSYLQDQNESSEQVLNALAKAYIKQASKIMFKSVESTRDILKFFTTRLQQPGYKRKVWILNLHKVFALIPKQDTTYKAEISLMITEIQNLFKKMIGTGFSILTSETTSTSGYALSEVIACTSFILTIHRLDALKLNQDWIFKSWSKVDPLATVVASTPTTTPGLSLFASRVFTKSLKNDTDEFNMVSIIINLMEMEEIVNVEVADTIGTLLVHIYTNVSWRYRKKLIEYLTASSIKEKSAWILDMVLPSLLTLLDNQDPVIIDKYNPKALLPRDSGSISTKVISLILCTLNKDERHTPSNLINVIGITNHPLILTQYPTDLWIRLCFRVGIKPPSLDLSNWFGLEKVLSGNLQMWVNAVGLVIAVNPEIGRQVLQACQDGLDSRLEMEINEEMIKIYKSDPEFIVFDPLTTNQAGLTIAQTIARLVKNDKKVYIAQVEEETRIRGELVALEKRIDGIFNLVTRVCEVTETSPEVLKVVKESVVGVMDQFLEIIKLEYATDGIVFLGKRTIQVLKTLLKVVVEKSIDTDSYLTCLFRVLDLNIDNQEVDLAKILVGYLQGLTELVENGPFTPTTFIIIFKLIESIVFKTGAVSSIKGKVYTDLVMRVSDLIISHVALDKKESISVPRGLMITSLIKLMEVYPRLRTSCQNGLVTICVSASRLEEEFEDENDDSFEEAITSVCESTIDGLWSCESVVRSSCLEGLLHLPIPDSLKARFDLGVWICKYDDEESVRADAEALWIEVNAEKVLDKSQVSTLAENVTYKNAAIRNAAGRALCDSLKSYPDCISTVFDQLFTEYIELAADPVPKLDAYGMVDPASLNKPDQWESRHGIAKCIESCEAIITSEKEVVGLFKFLIEKEALCDKNDSVQHAMLSAGLKMLENNAKPYIKVLLDLFDKHLSMPPGTSKSHDIIRESIVVLMGTLARHLDPADPRIASTVSKLIETLSTPSESVQVAVSQCVPALIKMNKERVPVLVKELLNTMFTSEKYGTRRGAAYGLAGIVKGAGISSLKEHQIMAQLKDAVSDKKSIFRREGALFAFETLSYTLGRTFEPYVIQLLPHLLICYGDSNKQIRDATGDACRAIMSKLSAHCVKLVMPSLIDGLQERAFRTKIGAIEVMASMSSLAPKQLGQSLPTVVPKICEALGDSHQKVQVAAKDALAEFGKVIKNPEIQELVPILINALVNPNNMTQKALTALLNTTFVHYIDSPSLALLVPIILRGMKERSAETKKKAAQIVGNMSSLTDPKDLIPYLDNLLPPLKEVLIDPVPEARTTAARAYGSLVQKLGEQKFPGLVDELLDTLKSDSSSVDRSGAAQGLSEVLAGIGIERLDGLLSLILNNANSIKPTTREGFTTLLVYLPTTFGERFTPYIAQIVPTMLEGLADETDTVREAALAVGQVIVKNYAKSAVSLLLPELEKGLFNDNWRIRQNSVQLMGDLVFRIAGITQLIETDDEQAEGFGTETHRTALKAALGDQYETVLASLFIVRADSSGLVRQSAVGVWKAVVANTPRTLKQILPVLMNILLASLASESQEKRGVAARTLGDLVRRLGDGILSLIIPILEKGLSKGDSDTREGVCIGLSEMMQSAGKSLVVDFLDQCTPLIATALIDSSPDVRSAAAQAFDILHQLIGSEAIDKIIPVLLSGIKTDQFALEGLKEIMAVRSNVVFPVLMPTLLSRPITKVNAQALASLITVAGSSLNRRLDSILPVLIDELEGETKAREEILSALDSMMTSIEGDGVYRVVDILTTTIREGSFSKKITSVKCLSLFFSGTEAPIEDYVGDALSLTIGLLSNSSEILVLESWNCLNEIVKRLKKDDLDSFVKAARSGIRDAERDLNYGEEIAGFNLPKSLSPILSILLQGLISGSAENREIAAQTLGDLVTRTSESSLKPFVTQMTGPLIRVIGDRFAPSVKTAILGTLALLLSKVPGSLKPFLPQLQRTFVKTLSEAGGTQAMRSKTAQCLSALIPLQTRLDPLVLELVQGIKTADETVEPAMWDALNGLLRGVTRDSGKSISDASQNSILSLIHEKLLQSGENGTIQRIGAAKCFGSICNVLPLDRARGLLFDLVSKDDQDVSALHGILLAISLVYSDAPDTIKNSDFSELAAAKVIQCLDLPKSYVVEAAVQLSYEVMKNLGDYDPKLLLEALIKLAHPGNEFADARREAIIVLKKVAKYDHARIKPVLQTLLPNLMLSVRDRTIPIKLVAERALVYVLNIRNGTAVLDECLKGMDALAARSIGDYARRVLVKIGERESDDESEL